MLILMYSVLCIEGAILYALTIFVKKVLKYLNILLFKHFNKFKKEKKIMQFKDLHRFI